LEEESNVCDSNESSKLDTIAADAVQFIKGELSKRYSISIASERVHKLSQAVQTKMLGVSSASGGTFELTSGLSEGWHSREEDSYCKEDDR